MANSTTTPTTFKVVKSLDNWYLIQECILTQKGQALVKNLQANWMSEEWICSILLPYDTTKKTQVKDKELVSAMAQYFKKSL